METLPAEFREKGETFTTASWFLWSLSALLCAAIGLVSYRYLANAGPVPPLIAANTLKAPWLLLHVVCAATALLIAPVQLLPMLRRRYATVHRALGRVYAICCLVGGGAGLAWRAAVRRAFAEHRAWMLRSFALTNAAVTLRLYLVLLPALPISFVVGYRAISFLCWVPNLLVAEIYLRKQRAPQLTPPAS